MLAQVHFPNTLQGEELDRYLAEGWFRMGQTIFTTNFLNFKQQYYSAVWLRVVLNQCNLDTSHAKLEKLNRKFNVQISEAKIDQERENLFSRYRQQVSFEPSSSIQSLLFGRAQTNIFNTLEITVRDEGRLIACGFFDLGKRSTAGITSFYNPDYKKYSLGKFLIFQKIEYSKKAGFEFFYPGYFVPGYKPFDYKLKIHAEAQQYFDLASSMWKSTFEFSSSNAPLAVMHCKLKELADKLSGFGIPCSVLKYDYYDANLVPDLAHMELFDFPVFVQYFDFFEDAINSVVVYDVRDDLFHWMIVKSVWKSDQNAYSEDSYSAHLLKLEEEVIKTKSADEMSILLKEAIKNQLVNQRLG
jgi:leucyl-tRNA---protein transferase